MCLPPLAAVTGGTMSSTEACNVLQCWNEIESVCGTYLRHLVAAYLMVCRNISAEVSTNRLRAASVEVMAPPPPPPVMW